MDCNLRGQCLKHPRMLPLIEEYSKTFEERDFQKISELAFVDNFLL